MIDWNRVEELKQELGPDDFAEVAEIFVEEVDEVIDRLKAQPDMEALEADMHFLKGSALNLGFQHLSKLCRDGEIAASAGNGSDFDLASVFTAYAESRALFLNALP